MSYFSVFNDGNAGYISSQVTEEESTISSKELWQDLITRSIEIVTQVNEYLVSKNGDNTTPENSDLAYLNEFIFPILLPILEKALNKAIRMESLTNQKSLFNGIDYISERLWISNPKYPERLEGVQNIFLFEWVQKWLNDHPRLIFPKSWIWSKEEAANIIAAYMKGYFVRKTDEVQEMRQFWKALALERKEKVEEEQQNDEDENEKGADEQ